MIVDNLGA